MVFLLTMLAPDPPHLLTNVNKKMFFFYWRLPLVTYYVNILQNKSLLYLVNFYEFLNVIYATIRCNTMQFSLQNVSILMIFELNVLCITDNRCAQLAERTVHEVLHAFCQHFTKIFITFLYLNSMNRMGKGNVTCKQAEFPDFLEHWVICTVDIMNNS